MKHEPITLGRPARCGHLAASCGCMPLASDAASRLNRRHVLQGGLATALSRLVGGATLLGAAAGCATPAGGSRQRTLVKGGTVLTLDPRLGDLRGADLLIEGERIAAVGMNLEAGGAEVIDARNCIVVPGFVDTHRHMWQGLLRNVLPDGSLADYLRIVLGQYGVVMRPDDVYVGNLVSALGALDAGVTTILDWSHIQNTPEHTDAAIAALRASGIRAVFGYGGPQVGKRWWQDNSHRYPDDIRRLKSGPFASSDQLLTLALAATGPTFGTQEVAAREWAMAREVGVRLTTHLGVGNSRGTLEPLGRAGLLNVPATYIHCNNLSETEWAMIRDTGGTVSVASQIEMNMGHGIPATQAALEHGVRPSLSVDVETSVPGDFFTQMRSTMLVQRGLSFERTRLGEKNVLAPMTARMALEFATLEGARANGLLDKVGSLTPGKQADLLLLRTDRINVLPVNDPCGAIVQGMDTSNVDSVFVAGKAMKRSGRLVGVDVAAIEARVRAAQQGVLTRAASRG